MKDYSLYIFDFDMTLVDSMKGVRRCYKKAFEAVGLPFDEKMCGTYVRESIELTFNRYSDAPCRRREFIAAFLRESELCMLDNTTIFPETEHVIKTLMLRGKHLCIVSGKMEERIRMILHNYQLSGAFEHIFGFDRAIEPKPSPYGLNWVMSQYDIPKEKVCYIGDARNDMLAAQNAGIDGIFIPRDNPEDAPCVARIRTLEEVLDITQ